MDIRKLRKKIGLSQWALAKLVGKSQATIQVWEAGYREPSDEDKVALAQAVGVEVDELTACMRH